MNITEQKKKATEFITRWENGVRNPKDETVEKLDEIFGISFDYLKGRDDGLDDIVDILRKVELTDKQKLEIYFLINKYLKL